MPDDGSPPASSPPVAGGGDAPLDALHHARVALQQLRGGGHAAQADALHGLIEAHEALLGAHNAKPAQEAKPSHKPQAAEVKSYSHPMAAAEKAPAIHTEKPSATDTKAPTHGRKH